MLLQWKRLRKGKTKVKKCSNFILTDDCLSLRTEMLFQWRVEILLPLGIHTAHLSYVLDNFFNLPKCTSVVKWYTAAKSIFLMVRWLYHLSWYYRLFSINIHVLIKSHISWKHNDSPVKEILSVNLKLISPVHTLYA